MPRQLSLQTFFTSHSSKDGGGFLETARMIARESPPGWLVKYLRDWSCSIMLDVAVHTKQLGKAEARARLKKLGEAAELVECELRDSNIAGILLAEEFGSLPNLAGIDSVLREIHRRTDEASSRHDSLRAGLNERLKALGDGANLVAREVSDPILSEFLPAEQIGPQPATMELSDYLANVRRRADAALLSPLFGERSWKDESRPQRALPPNASSPRAFCAAVILEAWAYFHDGEYPAASNLTLAAIAEEYWPRCGGTTQSWGTDPRKAWRPYFREASEPPLHTLRQELRRDISLSVNNRY